MTKLPAFWDSFKSTIHTTSDMSAIDKSNYLKESLEEPAAQAIQGLGLLKTNYTAAVEILLDKPKNVIIAHMDELLKLPVCINDKSHQLRLVYDKGNAHMCGLESLGIGENQYGSFLIPAIMSKLPDEIISSKLLMFQLRMYGR